MWSDQGYKLAGPAYLCHILVLNIIDIGHVLRKINNITNCTRGESSSMLLLLMMRCFTARRHFSCHFGGGQLTYPRRFLARLLGSLPVLSAHSFASNCTSWISGRERMTVKNYFMTNLHERMLSDLRTEPAIVRIPGGRVSDRATTPGHRVWIFPVKRPIRFIITLALRNP